MCIGPDEGCHAVPDPIAPIDITFVSLEPTRMPMSLPSITTSGPISIDSIGCIPSIWLLGDGLAIGMLIFCSGDGEAAGICIPGVCRWGCVPDGDAVGLGVAEGMGLAAGLGLAVGFGIW